MQSYDWAIIERSFEKRDIYNKGYEIGENKAYTKAFDFTIEILSKKDMIIRMYENNLSIEKIGLYVDLDETIVQKIIDNLKNEFDFKMIKRIIEELNLREI